MKKSLIIIISVFLLLIVSQICNAQQLINKDYPILEGIELRLDMKIQDLIRYIYLFALGAVGFIALLGIMIGAVMYVTSAGNPSKAANAKEQILSAVLGVLLLLASVLILRTINPDLVSLELEEDTVTVPITSDEETTDECRFLSASWDKAGVDVRDTAKLIFEFNKACADADKMIIIQKINLPFLRQERPNYWDPICDIYSTDEPPKLDMKNLTWSYTVKFEGECRGEDGITECPWPFWTNKNGMCNFHEAEPEVIYAEGSFVISNGITTTTQYVPRLPITVRDYR